MQRRIKARLAETGLALFDVEAIWFMPETNVAALLPAVDLGARYVLTVGHDPDWSRMRDNLANFAEACVERSLRPMLEFIPYSKVRTLAEAHKVLRGASPEGMGLLVDALHLSRSGGSPADLAQYDPALFSCFHLCDAPATPPSNEELRAEARGDRLYPGEGGLWLQDFVAACPPGTPAAIEAPSQQHAALSHSEQARFAGAVCRTLLSTIALRGIGQ